MSTIYSRLIPGRFIDKLALKKRQAMYQLFIQEFGINPDNTLLDVGVTADINAISSNYLEKLYPFKNKITALSDQDGFHLEKIFPGVQFKLGDARNLPFENNSMDLVFSSAVIEHVGSYDNQKRMVSECVRVAKKAVFITTPNRWHPMEAHTLLPLIHWLPKKFHRKLLKTLGMRFYATEENLNLLDCATLTFFCKDLGLQDYVVRSIKTVGFASNLILLIKKQSDK